MIPFRPLLAQATRDTYELARFQDYQERWHLLVLAAVCALVIAFVIYMYKRDSVELRPGVGVLLAALRVLAFVGILAYYLNLEKRSESEIIHNSRVLVLVDTSLSMGLHDIDNSSSASTPNRLEQVVAVLDKDGFIKELSKKHDVSLVRFDSETNRVISFNKLNGDVPKATASERSMVDANSSSQPTEIDPTVDWQKTLSPQGAETKLGQSLKQVITDERSGPLAAVVLFSDGGQNAGIDTNSAIETAREAKVPVYTVGIGSNRRPANVRVSDFLAPSRAYPGDSFIITAYVQAQELAGRSVTVELSSRPAGTPNKNDEGKLEGTERIALAANGEVVPVKFQITPGEAGRRTFRFRIKAPAEDNTVSDDQAEADVEIVDRKTRVLLVASGPTREYVFLRNQLRRDKEFIVDVWLQSGQPGISQDADKILDEFPSTAPELFEYDAIVAFDPDWQDLTPEQVDLFERWIGEKAGGLVAIAGPVEMDRWAQDPKLSKIRALYPIEVNRRLAALDDARYGSETPWPIEFTREGLDAEFLWLADSGSDSQQIWTSFPGVFGYYSVRGPKPGATVYGRYSDPESATSEGLPVYMVGQFYGAGRVFYLGSGEMWRLRSLDDSYFEKFYTKLVRYVSQGRLLLGSSRGMLLVDRDRYMLGNTVELRAQLSNAQFEPLELPRASVQVVRPDSTVDTLHLLPDSTRKGMYNGQFTVLQEGTYRLEMALPDGEAEQLTRRIQVKVPDLERENPQRNDALLKEIAERTDGKYYVGAETILGNKGLPALAQQLKDRTETTFLAGVTDREFDRQWMKFLLAFICIALSLEWIIRRLAKLA